ncbi:MAG: DUF1080 domain-containing protein, partial [Acidobacteriota bacterium]|nr:DUF1080 domain-containing protein [Acidobacteriota bacterium]
YGKGRVYTTMLGHTWKNEANPNLDDVAFQALLARGTEWAATGAVTLPADLGWKPLFNGRNLDGWEIRGQGEWNALPGGVLVGHRSHPPSAPFGEWPAGQRQYRSWFNRHCWLYTKAEFGEFDLHLEYWIPPHGNSGVSIRDRSRAHGAVGEPDAERPDLAGFPKTTPAHIGYEIQIVAAGGDSYQSGSVYSLVPAKAGLQREGEWNSLEIESRKDAIRVAPERPTGVRVPRRPGAFAHRPHRTATPRPVHARDVPQYSHPPVAVTKPRRRFRHQSKHMPNRRDFLKSLAAPAAIGFPTIVPAAALGMGGAAAPSDRVTLATIGVGWMGGGHVDNFLKIPEAQYLAVCDVDDAHAAENKAKIDKKYGNTDCKIYKDLRRTAVDAKGHRRRQHRGTRPLARNRRFPGRARRQGHLLRKASGA